MLTAVILLVALEAILTATDVAYGSVDTLLIETATVCLAHQS